jgi:uncharacterized protein (DUF488 family)
MELHHTIFTIGHSTRSLEEFINILKFYKIELVVDVRRFPSSKKFPWFNKENLEKELNKERIEYIHYPELGGYRKEGYEAFSKSKEFQLAINNLLEKIGEKNAVILCSEIKWWKCHRRYIANALGQMGKEVIHIWDEKKTQVHKPGNKEIEEKMKTSLYCDRAAKK